MKPQTRTEHILHEFQHHFPFTILATVIALLLLGVLTQIMPEASGATGHDGHDQVRGIAAIQFAKLFHVFHPLHVLLSAVATAAMFWRYDRRLLASIAISAAGSVGLCGISDIIFPWVGGRILGMDMELHICVIEHPRLVLPFSAIGILTGIIAADAFQNRGATIFSHAMHVAVATGGAVLYLVGYGLQGWEHHLFEVFCIVVFSVMVPCCSSDILFPLLLINPKGVHWCHGECADEE